MKIETENPAALNEHGSALLASGRFEEALASFDKALTLQPNYPQALNSRGAVLHALGRSEAALASFDKALTIQPDYVRALNNRGVVLQALNRVEDALTSFDKALALQPALVDVHYNRGNALLTSSRFGDAVESFDRALAIKPDHAQALNNRGTALLSLSRFDEALASFDQALTTQPAFAEALNNRGTALRALARLEEALTSYDQALTIQPAYVEALNNRADTLGMLTRHAKAIPDYERVLQLAPAMSAAKGSLLSSRLQCCDWRSFNSELDSIVRDIRAGKPACPPFVFLGLSGSPREQLLCARAWVRNQYPASPTPIWNGERYRHDRIRVAYLSADFRSHPVSHLLVEAIERHDRKRFQTIAVSYGPDTTDEMRERIKDAFENFVDVRAKSDRDTARVLRDLEVDIAVDLTGFTQHGRLGIFALRSVPIQISYLGYLGTTSAEYIDYIIADRYVIPAKHQSCYTEKIVLLPDTFQANPSKRAAGERIPTRAEAGLPEKGFVFCSFNNNYKFTPPVFDIWMRLLRQVDGSILWLLANNSDVERNLRREAEARGIPASRLIFAPRVSRSDYLARYALADLFLDTLPHNASTTASDALSAGTLVVTCSGEAFAARMAGSILNAVGLSELITSSLEEYERLALRLARDDKALADIRAKLARNLQTHPLFDVDRFCRNLETSFVTMWERQQRGELPASFAVEQ